MSDNAIITRKPIRGLLLRGRRVVPLMLVVALGGCANISDDRTRTRTEGTVAGAAIGSALGIGMGMLLGRANAREMIAGGVAGAAAGGFVGSAHGDAVARKKAAYAAAEAGLDARLAGIEKQKVRFVRYNANLREFIQRKEGRLARVLAADYRPGTSAEEFVLQLDVSTRLKEVDREANNWQYAIDDHKQALEILQRSAQAVVLRGEIETLSLQQEELQRHRTQLSAIESRIPR